MTIRFDLIFLSVALAVLLAGLLSFLLPERSYACSCLPLGSPTEELEESGAVFMGKVTSISILEGTGNYDTAMNEFAVTTVWKGPLTEKRTITARLFEPACGRTFGGAEEYVVYSYNGTWDSFCSRTRLLSKAASDLGGAGRRDRCPLQPHPLPRLRQGADAGYRPNGPICLFWG